uniref:18 kDa Sin3-associated polypeptide n=1 Tax=Meloidogyne javanica TaxID=6303 RepID=A0A915LM41_MELJA
MTSNVVSQVEVPIEKTIDREKVCPLLLRIFCAQVRHNSMNDYSRGSVPPNELQIYTCKTFSVLLFLNKLIVKIPFCRLDCTLKELTSLIKDVNPDARRRGTEFNFAIVAPDRYSARYALREVGITISGQRSPDDEKSLSQCKFEVGDYIDVVINPPDTGIAGGRGNAAHGVYGAQRRSGERVERDRTGSFSGGGGGRYGGFGR